MCLESWWLCAVLSYAALEYFWAEEAFVGHGAVFGYRVEQAGETGAFCWRFEDFGVVHWFDVYDFEVFDD
jgi:hypothetical protein